MRRETKAEGTAALLEVVVYANAVVGEDSQHQRSRAANVAAETILRRRRFLVMIFKLRLHHPVLRSEAVFLPCRLPRKDSFVGL
jgi:hypothetical protein